MVELMIVVAIIGILAAIAIPNFVSMQYRAKRGEVAPRVQGIQSAELAYDAAYDAWAEERSDWPADGGGCSGVHQAVPAAQVAPPGELPDHRARWAAAHKSDQPETS